MTRALRRVALRCVDGQRRHVGVLGQSSEDVGRRKSGKGREAVDARQSEQLREGCSHGAQWPDRASPGAIGRLAWSARRGRAGDGESHRLLNMVICPAILNMLSNYAILKLGKFALLWLPFSLQPQECPATLS